MRRAARRDENEKSIVEALRAVGATVYYLDEPCDLLIGYNGQTVLMELKNPKTGYGKKGFNENQKHFAENWKGGLLRPKQDYAVFPSIESEIEDAHLLGH